MDELTMTSTDLGQTQETLTTVLKLEMDKPMIDFTKVRRLLKVIQDIDSQRRILWNEEKFGYTDNIVAGITKAITVDDISF
jgi:hypothetical protein